MDTRPLPYLCSPELLHSYCWGEQCAVYHVDSGDTHLLDKVDLNVLQRIDEKPISAKSLSVEFEGVFDNNAGEYIQTLLSKLAELGLIEIVNTEPTN